MPPPPANASIVQFDYITTDYGGFKNYTGRYQGHTIILERWSGSTPVTIDGKRHIVKDTRIRKLIDSPVMYDDKTRRRWIEGHVGINGDGMLILSGVPIASVNGTTTQSGGKKKNISHRNTAKPKVHTGPRGGKYCIKGGKKVYL